MRRNEIRGAEVKVTGQCSTVEEIVQVLYDTCEVIHTSKMIYHDTDDGCHQFLTIQEVNA